MASASRPSALDRAALQAAFDGNLCLLKEMADRVNLHEVKDARGCGVLHLAAGKRHLELCRFLVEELGLDVNSIAAEGGSPVHFAAGLGEENILRYLLGRGGDPGMHDSEGNSPLHYVATGGNCEAVRLLLSVGVDVDTPCCRGTPLSMAASKDQVEVVKILLEHGADPNKVVGHVYSPLMMARCGHSLESMKLLVKAGADVNFVAPSGRSILTEATVDGLIDIVKFLLEAGADPNLADKDAAVVEERIADAKSQGKEAFAKGEYPKAIYFYALAMAEDPSDATLLANQSLCWLRLRDGDRALSDAQRCIVMRPDWSKAWYRQGAALSFLKDYKGAVVAFEQALKLDPAIYGIKKALREAIAGMECAAGSMEQGP